MLSKILSVFIAIILISSVAIPIFGYAKPALAQTTYQVFFTQQGVCCLATWSVTLNGVTESTTSPGNNVNTIIFNEPSGTYSYTINPPTGFSSQPSTGSVTVNGANPSPITINFVPQSQSSPLSVNTSPGSATINQGQSVTFTATPTGGSGGYSYTWYWQQFSTVNQGNYNSGTFNTYQFTPTSSGSYGVYVIVKDNSGNTAQSLESSITVSSGGGTSTTGNIQVMVHDKLTGNPLTGTTVSMTSAPSNQNLLSGTTDSSGQYTFQNVLSGSYQFQASVQGYTNNIGSGNVQNGQTAEVSIQLQQSSVSGSTITVGNGPYDVGVNSVTNTIYVSNQNSNTVSVINGNTNSVISTISTGQTPSSIGINTNTNMIYVANYNANTVSVIDGNTNAVTNTISVGSHPHGVAVNVQTNMIYVANSGTNTVSVINGNTNAVVQTITIGNGPFDIDVDSITNMIYTSNGPDSTVSVINGNTNTVVQTITVGADPFAIRVNGATNMIYVANGATNTVSVINGNTNTVVQTITVGSHPNGIGVDRVTNVIYVANNFDNTLSIINGNANTVMNTIAVGSSPIGVGVNSVTNMIYVANDLTTTISIIVGVSPPPPTPDTTSTTVSLIPTTIDTDGQTTVTATVTDTTTNTNPSGTVKFNDGSTSVVGSFGSTSCNSAGNSQLVCTATYTTSSTGSITINANYVPSNSNFAASIGSSLLNVTLPTSTVNISVLFKNNFYTIILKVPTTAYQNAVNDASTRTLIYPSFTQQQLIAIVYLSDYLNQGSSVFPILSGTISSSSSGQILTDSTLKTNIIDALLTYSYLVTGVGSPQYAAGYQTAAQPWLTAFQNDAIKAKLGKSLTVVDELVAAVNNTLLAIGNLYGSIVSGHIQTTGVEFINLIQGPTALGNAYGDLKKLAITQELLNDGLITSSAYDPIQLYQQLTTNPNAVTAFSNIDTNVFGLDLGPPTSITHQIITDFTGNIKTTSIASLPVGTAVGLYAYYHDGLSATAAILAGPSVFVDATTSLALPQAIAQSVSFSYDESMSDAIYGSWLDEGQVGTMYTQLNILGSNMNSPTLTAGAFSLDSATDFSGIYGTLQATDFFYSFNLYTYLSSELSPQQSPQFIHDVALSAIQNAQDWKKHMQEIQQRASAIINSVDPIPLPSFSFSFPMPLQVLPEVRNLNGTVIKVNSTSNVILRSSNYSFNVTNGKWISNFPDSFYLNDTNGTSYLVILDPPQGQITTQLSNPSTISVMEVNTNNTGSIILKNIIQTPPTSNLSFSIANVSNGTGPIVISTSGRINGDGIIGKGINFSFEVKSNVGKISNIKGTIDLNDQSARIKLHSDKISVLSVDSDMKGATFVGKGDLDRHKGDVTFVTNITDPDKTGDHDMFSIAITDSSGRILYHQSGIVKGHIEIHKFADHDDKLDSGINHEINNNDKSNDSDHKSH